MNERGKYDDTLATISKKESARFAIYHITSNVNCTYIYSRTIRAKHKRRLEHTSVTLSHETTRSLSQLTTLLSYSPFLAFSLSRVTKRNQLQ